MNAIEKPLEQTTTISRAALCKSMAQAFPKIAGAIKGSVNPAFKSRYADLAAVVDAIKPALAEHGLWFTQITAPHDRGVYIETILMHESGEAMSLGTLVVPAMKPDAQGLGSALSYARRYSLMAAFGVPAEDDDGNAASGRQPARSEPEPEAISNERHAELVNAFEECETREDFAKLFNALSQPERRAMRSQKAETMQRLGIQ